MITTLALGALARKKGSGESLEDIIDGLAVAPSLYVDASREAGADDDTIATVTDFSGNGRNLPVGAGEIGASLRTNIQNGLKALQWKGVSATGYRLASQELGTAIGSGGWGLNDEVSFYISFKKVTGTHDGAMCYWDSSGVGNNALVGLIWHTSAGFAFRAGHPSNDSFIQISNATMPHDANWHVWCITLKHNDAGFLYDSDGSVIYTDALGTTGIVAGFAATFGFGTFAVGADVNASWRGYIGEFIVCSEVHNQATRESILFAMANKWGL